MTREDFLKLGKGRKATIKGRRYILVADPKEVSQYSPVKSQAGTIRVTLVPEEGGKTEEFHLHVQDGKKHLEFVR